MNQRLLLFLIGLINCISCNRYENKKRYEIPVGKTVEIYYSTNSCCYYCLANENELKHIKFVDKKMIDPGPRDCEGCDYTGAFVFKTESKGVDTVKLKLIEATMECDTNDNITLERYIIEAK
jgi:hypothetical protein